MCCAGSTVTVRPDGSPGPQECPKEALKAMEYLRIHVGDSAIVEIDTNQTDQSPISLNDGPVESLLWTAELGCCFPIGTRLYGQIWKGGPSVVIRYYSRSNGQGADDETSRLQARERADPDLAGGGVHRQRVPLIVATVWHPASASGEGPRRQQHEGKPAAAQRRRADEIALCSR